MYVIIHDSHRLYGFTYASSIDNLVAQPVISGTNVIHISLQHSDHFCSTIQISPHSIVGCLV
jgi:hypothetical protein